MIKEETKKINRMDSEEVTTMDLLEKIRVMGEKYSSEDQKKSLFPAWSDNKRGVPNSLLESTLFSATQINDSSIELNEVVFKGDDLTIRYEGQQLNQSDLIVWSSIVHLFRNEKVGSVVEFSAYEMLTKLGLTGGKWNYEKLHKTIQRLKRALLTIDYRNIGYEGNFIDAFLIDRTTSKYQVVVNPIMLILYDNNQYTLLNFRIQEKLRKKPLALFLFGYYSQHKTPYPHKIETLFEKSRSKNKTLRGFKQKLKNSLTDLVDVEFLSEFEIKDDLVTIKRANIPAKYS